MIPNQTNVIVIQIMFNNKFLTKVICAPSGGMFFVRENKPQASF